MHFFETLESRLHLAGVSPSKAKVAGAANAVVNAAIAGTPRQVENLGRGIVALNKGSGSVFVSWRLLANDPASISFKLYRSTNGTAVLRSTQTTTTNFTDTGVDTTKSNTYFVRAVINGVEGPASDSFILPANAPVQQFQRIALNKPAGLTMPDATTCTYTPNDATVADLNGDGEYEMIVKWDPSNSKDNSQSGYTGNVYIDAYKMDGTQLWRIDLGRNIRAGAHYTQVMAYDFDGDGKAEIALRTAPGTVDGQGQNVLLASDSASADYRNSSGYILTGSEYLTMFNGLTGAAMTTIPYSPPRVSVGQWGDTYGNRVDRLLMCVAYLDGVHPSLVVGRGIFGAQSSGGQVRNEVVAYDWKPTGFTQRWYFKSAININGNINSAYAAQGTYDMIPADVDGDGKDEITYGAMAIDDDGSPLYTTRLGHGDALHVGDFLPSRPGLEVFMPHEVPAQYGINGGELRDARTGEILVSIDGHNADVGRGVALDIDPRYPGAELWMSSDPGIYAADGTFIQNKPSNMPINFGVQWDADAQSELLDGTTISDYRITNGVGGRVNYVYAPPNVLSDNGTKSTPMLSGDILGDWRDEVVWREADGNGLEIWSTTIPSTRRIVTMMHDVQYREAIAWQNVGYNQPPHPSFALDDNPPPAPNVSYVGDAPPLLVSSIVNDGNVQRSNVSSFTIAFNEAVTLNLAGVTVIRRGGTAVPFTATASADDKTYTLNFAGFSLPDGIFDVTLLANAVRDSANNPLDGGDRTFTFHRLLGDGDGNRVIDFNDFLGLQNAFGTRTGDTGYRIAFDFDANGAVNFNDFLEFQNRFGFTI